MPLDDEIIKENPVEGEENSKDNPSVYPSDSPDPEIGGNDSLVQEEEELGSDSPGIENLEPDVLPEGEDTENVEEGMDSVEDLDILDEILDQNHEDDYLLNDEYYSTEEEIMKKSTNQPFIVIRHTKTAEQVDLLQKIGIFFLFFYFVTLL